MGILFNPNGLLLVGNGFLVSGDQGGGSEPLPEGTLTQVYLQNTSSDPLGTTFYSFGQGFPQGDVPAGGSIVVPTLADNTPLTYHTGLRKTWPDGSLKWAEFTVAVPAIAANEDLVINLMRATGSWDNTPSRSNADFQTLDVNVRLTGLTSPSGGTVGSGNWHADFQTALAGGDVQISSDGPAGRSIKARTPFLDEADGAPHPTLIATFYVTAFTDPDTGTLAGFRHCAWVGQHWAFTTNHMYNYAAEYREGASVLRSFAAFNHPAYSCWSTRDADGLHHWSGGLSKPPLHVHWDAAGKRYWKRSWLIPNFFDDLQVTPETDPDPWDYVPGSKIDYGSETIGPGDGNLLKPGSDDNAHFGIITHWASRAFVSQEPSYVKHARVSALVSGHIPLHYLDDATGKIVNCSPYNFPGMPDGNTTLAVGFAWNAGGSPKPQGGSNGWAWDHAHFPSPVFYTYVTEGGHDLLDLQLQISNHLLAGTIPNTINRIREAGGVTFRDIFIRNAQLRGSGHGIREFCHGVAVAPDDFPETAYLEAVLNDQIDYAELRIGEFDEGQRYTGYWDSRNTNEYNPSFFYYHWINGLARAYLVTRKERIKTVLLEHSKNYLMGQLGKDYHCTLNWAGEYRGSTFREYVDGPFLTNWSTMTGPDPSLCTCSAVDDTITVVNRVGGRADNFTEGDRVRFTINGGYQNPSLTTTQPADVGLDHTKLYYIRNLNGDTFQLSETLDGPIMDITADGTHLRAWFVIDNPNMCPTSKIRLGDYGPVNFWTYIGYLTTMWAGVAMLQQAGVTDWTQWYERAKSLIIMEYNPTFNTVYSLSGEEDGTIPTG